MTATLTSRLCHAWITPGPQFLLSILLKTVSPIHVQSPLGHINPPPNFSTLDIINPHRLHDCHANILSLSCLDNPRSSIPFEYPVEDCVAHLRLVTPGSAWFTTKMPSGNTPWPSQHQEVHNLTLRHVNKLRSRAQPPSIYRSRHVQSLSYSTTQTQAGFFNTMGWEGPAWKCPNLSSRLTCPRTTLGSRRSWRSPMLAWLCRWVIIWRATWFIVIILKRSPPFSVESTCFTWDTTQHNSEGT